MARKTPKTKRIKTKNGYRYMVAGKFASKAAYDAARAKPKKNPAPKKSKAKRKKGDPTDLNLWVLKKVFGNKTEVPNNLSPTDVPHIRRCLKAGLLQASKGTITLTAKGKTAIKNVKMNPGKPSKKKTFAKPKQKQGLKKTSQRMVTIFDPDVGKSIRVPANTTVYQPAPKVKKNGEEYAAVDVMKAKDVPKDEIAFKDKSSALETARLWIHPVEFNANPATALSLQVARQIKDHLKSRGYNELTGPKKDRNRYEVSAAVGFKGKKTVAIIGVSQVGDRIEVTISRYASFGEKLIDQTKYDTQRAFGSMVCASLAKAGMKPYTKPVKKAKKTKPRKKAGVFAGFFKNPADMKKSWARVRKVFTEKRKSMSKGFPALIATGLEADQSVHDTDRHYAMTGKVGKNKVLVKVAPELGLLPISVIRGVLVHELAHAAVMLGFTPKRPVKGRSYDAIERNADRAAEQLSGAKIYYDKQGLERSGPGASGKRPRPKGLR